MRPWTRSIATSSCSLILSRICLQVVNYISKSVGRGVVGILRADYLEPTHNKQDFERTSLFQKLELRLKQMTYEYWDYHCHLIGYPERRTGAPGAPLNKRKKTHESIDLHKMKRHVMQENATVTGFDPNIRFPLVLKLCCSVTMTQVCCCRPMLLPSAPEIVYWPII
ncbi:unnamed protein product [Sphenostylis stenocarpa]|uniref:Morc S5 domain-containing protein n=1 Tax=Sphenostylis stenocarpa TaxID=92480 RepID=A0AA86S721_9FABA|nr:unnamed protein product [Sphenostylis stenocarpa]